MAKTIKLVSSPHSVHTEDELVVDSLEPWNLVKIFDFLEEKPATSFESALIQRTKGTAHMARVDRAFWLHMESSRKGPAPFAKFGAPAVEFDSKQLAGIVKGVRDAEKSFMEDGGQEGLNALDEEMEKTAKGLVTKLGDVVGMFASRGIVRPITFPDWVRAAVTVNTKAQTWEVVLVGNHAPECDLTLWLNAYIIGESVQEWSGNARRMRASGLPSLRLLNHAMGGIYSLVKDTRS